MNEVIALEEERLPGRLCKGVSKAVAEIKLGAMSAAFSEIPIGLASKSRVSFGDGFNNDPCFLDEIIEAPARDGIAVAVDNKCSFNEVGGGQAAGCASLYRECIDFRVGFVEGLR